jgi:hypothetical protein
MRAADAKIWGAAWYVLYGWTGQILCIILSRCSGQGTNDNACGIFSGSGQVPSFPKDLEVKAVALGDFADGSLQKGLQFFDDHDLFKGA